MPGLVRPASHTGLAGLAAVALDLETTGLDVSRDRVVQAAAIAMQGARVLDAPRLERLVDPGVAIPPGATGIHGIRSADVAGAGSFAELAEGLREILVGRVVIGHHVAFDLAVLRHEAARAGIAWHDPPALDVAMLVGALEPTLADLSLEAIAALLGVEIRSRHSAFGDAIAAAEIFARLLPRLLEADVRTLGEAQALAAQRSDLALREAQAGWHRSPGEAPQLPRAPQPPRIDSYVFVRRVREAMRAPLISIDAQASLREAARAMARNRIGALAVGPPGTPPEGILTERDLLRVLAAGELDLDRAPVAQAMSAPVRRIHADEMLYRALGLMDRLAIRHLCVVDGAGHALGMLSQRDLLAHRARSLGLLGDASQAGDAAALAALYSRVPEVATRLLAEGVGGLEVARVVSSEILAMTARAAQLASQRLAAAGRGEAPAPWCVIVLGSAGRGESLLAADQDNALVHAGKPGDDAWFADFGAHLANLLDEAGIPRCRGGVMAANAAWRGTLEDWALRLEVWLRRAKPEDLLNADIFFDLVPAAGDLALGRELCARASQAAGRARPFLGVLAASVADTVLPIGFFGRVRSEGGRTDLKRRGLMPIAGFGRALGLKVGSAARSTAGRLDDAAADGRLAPEDASMLKQIHADLATLVLRQQLLDLAQGVRPSGRVAIKRLSRQELRQLASQLRRLDDALRVLRGAVSA